MVYMFVGIQGSGKSTYAKTLQKKENIEIVSTDKIRQNNPGIEEAKVWPLVYDALASLESAGKNVIFDATNITPKVRARMKTELEKRNVKARVGVYYFKTDKQTCHDRVIKRNTDPKELYLPPEVVYSFSEKLIEPTLEEGFVFIKTVENGQIVNELYR